MDNENKWFVLQLVHFKDLRDPTGYLEKMHNKTHRLFVDEDDRCITAIVRVEVPLLNLDYAHQQQYVNFHCPTHPVWPQSCFVAHKRGYPAACKA